MKYINPIDNEKFLIEAEREVLKNLRASFMWARHNLTPAQRYELVNICNKADFAIIEKCRGFCKVEVKK